MTLHEYNKKTIASWILNKSHENCRVRKQHTIFI